MALVIAFLGLVGAVQGVVWLGASSEPPRNARKRRGAPGRSRQLHGAILAPISWAALCVGLLWALVPDFFT